MEEELVTDHPEGATVRVRVVPRAQRPELDGLHGNALKVRVQAPPLDGRANDEVRSFLAELLDVGKAEVDILAGAHNRDKTVLVKGVSAGALRKRVADVLDPRGDAGVS